jgi:hypothetical protein
LHRLPRSRFFLVSPSILFFSVSIWLCHIMKSWGGVSVDT